MTREPNVGAKAGMRAQAPSTTEEWDAMPTQALSSEDLAHMARTEEIPSLWAEMRAATVIANDAVQAIRVRLWHDATGLHIGPASAQVAAPSIEAVLVAVDGHDLAPWLSTQRKP